MKSNSYSRCLCALAAGLFLNFAVAPAFADDNYPRITAMENSILGKSYGGDALPVRLARMEVKAFGKASDKADLSDRTDSLQDFVEKSTHKQLVAPAPGYLGPDDQDIVPDARGNVQADAGDSKVAVAAYPRVTALEQAILGESHESEQLPARLARMEEKAFSKASDGAALGDRTDALEDYAEKKLHKKILGQSSTTKDSPDSGGSGGGAAASNGGGNFLAKMGGALLGLPMGGGGTPAGGGPSFFAPGFGPFAGMRVRPRTAAAQSGVDQNNQANQSNQGAAANSADIAVINASAPPPPATRLATKVAWCEKRIFGQPSYEKHLTDRLDALNAALSFDPGQKGMALMDDIDKLIKAAAARAAAPGDTPASAPPQD